MWSQNSVKRKPVYDTAIFLSYSKKKYKTLFSIIWFFLTDISISLITPVPRVSWNRICWILRRNDNLECPALLLIKTIKKYRDSKSTECKTLIACFSMLVYYGQHEMPSHQRKGADITITSPHSDPEVNVPVVYFPNRWFLFFFVQQSFVLWRARRKVN